MYSLRRIPLFVLLWAVAAVAVAMTPAAGQASRVTAGLQVLYGFSEGSGTTVQDISGVGSPLNLAISDGGAVSWLSGGGLDVNSSVTISSGGTATKIYSALQASNAMTVEAWLVPDNTDQFGPARIVTLSPDPNSANFSMGQGANGMPNDVYGMRLRSTLSSVHGTPSLPTPAGSLTTNLTHVVFTRNASGDRVMYLDGSQVASDNLGGDFSTWSTGDPLTLANVPTGDRPWLGEFHLVAVYDRALSPAEVGDNYDAGPDGGGPPVSDLICEDFDSGFTLGQPVGDHADWFGNANSPEVTAGIGLGGSIGLAPGSALTTWTGESFDFTNPDFIGVTFQMDFQTSPTGTFDDDRIGWMIADDNVSSDNIFGVQLDPGGSGQNIECYWDGDTPGDNGGRTSIADLPALSASTYYRLQATITKLTATSVQVDAALYEVDGAGNTGAVVASGSIPNTDLLPNTPDNEIPNTVYFTGPIWPALKNHTGAEGAVDNFCYELLGEPSSTYTLTTSTVGNGSITLDPPGGVYDPGTSVTVTAVADQDWTFLQWSGHLSGDMNPETIIMNGNRSVTAVFTNGDETVFCEDFESGFTLGAELNTHSDWFYEDGQSGPLPQAGIGVAGSVGLTTGNRAFTWVAHPFDWNDPTLNGVWFEMDFQTSGTGVFDDDRIGWTISDTDDSSDNIFGVQMDPGGSGAGGNIEAYWDGAAFGDNDGRSSIVDLPALTGNAWYRFHVDIIKLSATSARLDVTLTALDGAGNEGAIVASGTLADTDALPNTAGEAIPNPGYFTAATMWPVYKNFTNPEGAVDNPCFGIIGGTPVEYVLTTAVAGNGAVILDPPGGTYNGGTVVTVTADPDPDWTFGGWTGDLSGCDNPETLTMNGDKSVTAIFFQPSSGDATEDFEAGFTLGANVGEHPDWFDGEADDGSNVTAGIGVAGSIGLAPGGTIAIWTAHPFSWNDPLFRSATLRMDFQTDAAGAFDDDRLCYMIASDDNSSANAFGAQLDHVDGGIVTYWRDATGARIQDPIVDLPALTPNAFYRFTTRISKILDTSARLDVSIIELDPSGNPTGVPYFGSVDNTSTWPGGAPDDKYFTACAMWPAYKNHTAVEGAADNAFFDVETGPVTQHTVTVSVVGNGEVTLDPDQATYDLGSDVELTAVADPGWEFTGWSGHLTGNANPENLTITGNMAVTATFAEEGPLAAGDLIVSSIQAWNSPGGQDPGEFIEIFNTTGQTIALDNLEIISRTDNNSDGVVEVDWQLAADLTGRQIAPFSFFLVAESGVSGENGVRDVETDMDLATGEGGSAERAISVQLVVDGIHMDYVVYGRHDGTDPEGELPPGDRSFDGVSYPRTEVIRNTLGTASYQEGLLRREAAEDLYAGYDVEGFYTDEGSLPGIFPDGVWYSPHDNTDGSYQARNSTSTPVPPGGNQVPQAPVLVSPLNGGTNVPANPELRVTVNDPDLDAMDVTFFGREVEIGTGGDPFTVIPLPDTQKYSENYPANYIAQTQWVVDSILARNIIYLAHEGDMVEHAGTESEWLVADQAMSLLEDPGTTGMPEGLPYGVLPGNHDQPTGLYNTYFGTARFSGRGYYGGNYLSDNDNNYTLFSASGMDFIAVNLEYNPSSGAIAWADNLFQTFSDRRGIVVSHYMMETNGAWSSAGSSIYEAVKDNPNVFLMLCGHKHGEAVRTDTFNGNVIYSVLADYQDLPNGGNGWLRIMEFRPADNQIYVETYSPVLDEFGTDTVMGDDTTAEAFVLNYEMGGSKADFTNLGTASGVASGADAVITWSGLLNLTDYEWFVEISDGVAVTTGPTWSFTTADVSGVENNTVPSRLEAPGNYPNPFNPMTRLRFALPASGHVEVTVYDVKGRAIRNLVNRDYPQGRHEVVWDGRDDSGQVLSSGTYLYQVKAGGSVVSGKMVLMK